MKRINAQLSSDPDSELDSDSVTGSSRSRARPSTLPLFPGIGLGSLLRRLDFAKAFAFLIVLSRDLSRSLLTDTIYKRVASPQVVSLNEVDRFDSFPVILLSVFGNSTVLPEALASRTSLIVMVPDDHSFNARSTWPGNKIQYYFYY